jgi:hypothetical protein
MGLISFVAKVMGIDDLRKEAKDLIDELLGTDSESGGSRRIGSKGSPRYNMEGNYLYDVHRGTTWMYDPELKSFTFIPRKISGPQYSMRKMQLEEEIRLMRKKIGSKLGKKESKEHLQEMGEEIFNRMREALDLMNPYRPK